MADAAPQAASHPSLHPAAPHDLPSFITAPGDTDVLMVVVGLILLLAIVAFGLLFLRLHTLPERMAHKSQKIQFEIVAVLGLIALFTHMHIFWIAGLLLALIDLPDFGSSLGRIATSTERMAGIEPGQGADVQPDAGALFRPPAAGTDGEAASLPSKPGSARSRTKKELSHA